MSESSLVEIRGLRKAFGEFVVVDQLDMDTILTPGQSVSLLLPLESYEVSYDVQAVDEDTDSYTFSVSLDNSENAYQVAVEMSDID